MALGDRWLAMMGSKREKLFLMLTRYLREGEASEEDNMPLYYWIEFFFTWAA